MGALPLLAGTYDPADVLFTPVGVPLLSGYAEGSMVEWGRDKDSFSDYAGSQGEVCIVVNRDKRGYFRFFLHQNSLMNNIFSGMLATAEATGGRIILPSRLSHKGAGTELFAAQSWLQRLPDGGYSNEIQGRQWMIRCAAIVGKIGGVPLI